MKYIDFNDDNWMAVIILNSIVFYTQFFFFFVCPSSRNSCCHCVLIFIHIIFKYPHVWCVHDTFVRMDAVCWWWWSMCIWKEKKEIVVQVRLWCMQLIIYYSCMCFRVCLSSCVCVCMRAYVFVCTWFQINVWIKCLAKMIFFFLLHDTDKCNPI